MEKNPPAKVGDMSSIPGLGRSPREGNGNPLQYSCWGTTWMEEPAGYSSCSHKRVRHDLANKQQ